MGFFGNLFKSEFEKWVERASHEELSDAYEEERRLFYVALTRTRNYIYLLVPKNDPSIFIKELIKDNKKDIEIIHNY